MSEDLYEPAAEWMPFTVYETAAFAHALLSKALEAQGHPVPLNDKALEFYRDPEDEGVVVFFPAIHNFGFVGLLPLPDVPFVYRGLGFMVHLSEEDTGVMVLFEKLT